MRSSGAIPNRSWGGALPKNSQTGFPFCSRYWQLKGPYLFRFTRTVSRPGQGLEGKPHGSISECAGAQLQGPKP